MSGRDWDILLFPIIAIWVWGAVSWVSDTADGLWRKKEPEQQHAKSTQPDR